MVTQIEHRLEGDERVWDKLVQVFESCGVYDVLVEKFKHELERELARESVPTERSAPRKFASYSQLYAKTGLKKKIRVLV